ncbi:PREDICTED: B3 domain-containing protein At5g18000-like [Camelina sativa]|uniref:B3 domain-containing protein At5g18000-like n=1 Tax=Camelina sativa TaxID=90675 RepID=A0ABM1QBZ6_CAMSA|nr:PREDICTED: B3 domain-containing protein At5g18000-like [Camelina sativa]
MVRNRVFGQVMEEGDNPAFFKILRREDLSSEIMVENDSSSLDKKHLRQVSVVKDGLKSAMGKLMFVNDNGLGENEYLTFTHEANRCFNVNTYEENGKEMLKPRQSSTITSSSGRSKREERNSNYIDVKKDEETGIPKKFVDMHMPNQTKMFKIHHPTGKKSWEVTYVVTDVQSRFSAGWSRFAKELGLEVGDVCTFKLIEPTEICVKVSKE